MALSAARNEAVRHAWNRAFPNFSLDIEKPAARVAVDAAHDWIIDTGAKPAGTTANYFFDWFTTNASVADGVTSQPQKVALLMLVMAETQGFLDKVGRIDGVT